MSFSRSLGLLAIAGAIAGLFAAGAVAPAAIAADGPVISTVSPSMLGGLGDIAYEPKCIRVTGHGLTGATVQVDDKTLQTIADPKNCSLMISGSNPESITQDFTPVTAGEEVVYASFRGDLSVLKGKAEVTVKVTTAEGEATKVVQTVSKAPDFRWFKIIDGKEYSWTPNSDGGIVTIAGANLGALAAIKIEDKASKMTYQVKLLRTSPDSVTVEFPEIAVGAFIELSMYTFNGWTSRSSIVLRSQLIQESGGYTLPAAGGEIKVWGQCVRGVMDAYIDNTKLPIDRWEQDGDRTYAVVKVPAGTGTHQVRLAKPNATTSCSSGEAWADRPDGFVSSTVKSLTYLPAPTIAGSGPDGMVGDLMRIVPDSTHLDGATFSLKAAPAIAADASGAAPQIDPATGEVSFVGTQEGPYSVTVMVSDAGGTSEHTFTGTLRNRVAPSIGGTAPDGVVGVGYEFDPEVSVDPTATASFDVTDGELPAGLRIATDTGKVSGTPTKAGTFTFTITVTDGRGATASHAFTITVFDPAAVGRAGSASAGTAAASDPSPTALAITGADSAPIAVVAMILLAAGAAVLIIRRRAQRR